MLTEGRWQNVQIGLTARFTEYTADISSVVNKYCQTVDCTKCFQKKGKTKFRFCLQKYLICKENGGLVIFY